VLPGQHSAPTPDSGASHHLIDLGWMEHTLSDLVLTCRMFFLTVQPVRRHPSWFSMWMVELMFSMHRSQRSLSSPSLEPPVRCHPSWFSMWMAKWMSSMGCRVNIQLPLRMVAHRPCHLIDLGQSGHTLSDDVLICRMVFLTVLPVRCHPS
jgi:hypothetical protein